MTRCSLRVEWRGLAALTVVLLAAALFVGCAEQAPPPPPTPPPPPEPSPEQIKAEIMGTLAPLQGVISDPAAPLSDDVKKSVIDGLQAARTKHQNSENGKQALAMVANNIEGVISAARDQKRWALVMGAIEAYEVLSPGTTKMNRLKERAQLYLNRPTVTIQGFMDDKERKDTYVFLRVSVPPKNEVNAIQVKPGDEFSGVRLVDIIGDKKGVRLEYLAIPGDTWDVMTGR